MAKKKPVDAAAAGKTLQPPKGGVTIRMYRHGLGDCFLLAFDRATGGPFYMLVDCGVILGTSNPGPLMTEVATNILDATGGHVHMLVSTHEHWDHLSGFLQAQAAFQKLAVDTVLFAWTEDPTNALANELRKKRVALKATVQALHAKSAAVGLAGSDGVRTILDFFGAAGGNTTGDALTFLKGIPSAQIRYCVPGEPRIAIPGSHDVGMYVLGPPQDVKALHRVNPSAQHETYDKRFTFALEDALLMAAEAGTADPEMAELAFPFDKSYRKAASDVQPPGAASPAFFDRYYFGPGDDGTKDQSWRRIENDWLNVSEQLALQLDSYTNNTSLVLAIELGKNGKVILLAADAQVGNWLSWGDYSWPATTAGGAKVTAEDLLGRTVYYKVGHHGSHNATMRERGLELMKSPELVAFIPVNHEMAIKKGWGEMPFQELLQRLDEKCAYRVVRGDGSDVLTPPAEMPAAVWADFSKRTRMGPGSGGVGRPLWVDYDLG